MDNFFLSKFQRGWVAVSIASLILPFALSFFDFTSATFAAIMTYLLGAVAVLSFPTSLFALPFGAFFTMIMEMSLGSLFTVYLLVGLLNVVGYVQWFHLAPTLLGTKKPMSLPTIFEG